MGAGRIVPMLVSVSCYAMDHCGGKMMCTLGNHSVQLIASNFLRLGRIRLMRRQVRGIWMVHMSGGRQIRRISRNWDIRRYTIKEGVMLNSCDEGRMRVCCVATGVA